MTILAAAVTAVTLAVVGTTAVGVRAHAFPRVGGPWSRLIEILVGLTVLLVVAESLGSFGRLQRPFIPIACGAVGAVLIRLSRRIVPTPDGPLRAPDEKRRWVAAAAMLMIATTAGAATVHTLQSVDRGMTNIDSLTYHLPTAAAFAMDGRTTEILGNIRDPSTAVHPNNWELLLGVTMELTGTDIAVPFLGLGAMALVVLAGWCLGETIGREWEGAGGAALVLGSPLALVLGGTAKNDGFAMALSLGVLAVGLRLREASGEDEGGIDDGGGRRVDPWALLLGITAGLAVGTKLTALPIVVAAVAIGLLTRTPRVPLHLATAQVGVMAALSGGYWYVRNWVAVGSPLPTVRLWQPPISDLHLDLWGGTIIDYASPPSRLRVLLRPLWESLSWPAVPLGLLLVIGLCGAVVGRGRFPVRLLVAALVVATAVWVVTPFSAFGLGGTIFPSLIGIRYLHAALAVGALVGLVVLPARGAAFVLATSTIAIIVVAAAELDPDTSLEGILVALAVATAVFASMAAPRWIGSVPWWPARAVIVAGGLALALPLAGTVGSRWMASRTPPRLAVNQELLDWAVGQTDIRMAVEGIPPYALVDHRLRRRADALTGPGPFGEPQPQPSCTVARSLLERIDYDYLVIGDWYPFDPLPALADSVAAEAKRVVDTNRAVVIDLRAGSGLDCDSRPPAVP